MPGFLFGATASGKDPRAQPRMEPGDHGIDVVDREPDLGLQRGCIGWHVGAFEHDRADIRVPRNEFFAGLDDVAFRQSDIHVFLFGLDQDAEEFLAVFGADQRRIERRTGAFEMRRR